MALGTRPLERVPNNVSKKEEEEEEEILLNFPHLRIPWHTTLYPGTRPLQTSTRTN